MSTFEEVNLSELFILRIKKNYSEEIIMRKDIFELQKIVVHHQAMSCHLGYGLKSAIRIY